MELSPREIDGDVSRRKIRDRFESISLEPIYPIHSNPPWIAKQLAFTLNDNKDSLHYLITTIQGYKGDYPLMEDAAITEITYCTQDLGKFIVSDPRLADLLDFKFLQHMYRLLTSREHLLLQGYAAGVFDIVISCSRNKQVVDPVVQLITPLVLDLISYQHSFVQIKALWLFRILVFQIPQSTVEQALTTVTSIILDDSYATTFLEAAAEILFYVCQVHPKLPQDKLSLVLLALMKLVESDKYFIYPHGCRGLACLCDGREEMVVESKDFLRLVRRLVDLLTAEQPHMINYGLIALGSIVKWSSDDDILDIIGKTDLVLVLSSLFEDGNMWMVKQTCWIISNITARKGEHVTEIGFELFDKLVNVVRSCELADVVKEALWAISNAMCAVDSRHSEFLRNNCLALSWDELLFSCQSDMFLVFAILEGLVNIKGVHFVSRGQTISNVVQLRIFFNHIVHDTDFPTKCDTNNPHHEFRKQICFEFKGCRPPKYQSCVVWYDDLSHCFGIDFSDDFSLL